MKRKLGLERAKPLRILAEGLAENLLGSQHPHGSLRPSVAPVPRDLMSPYDLPRYQVHMWYTYIDLGKASHTQSFTS